MFQSKSDAIKRDNNVPARYYNGKIVLKVAIETVRNNAKNTPSGTCCKNDDKFGFAKFRGNLREEENQGHSGGI